MRFADSGMTYTEFIKALPWAMRGLSFVVKSLLLITLPCSKSKLLHGNAVSRDPQDIFACSKLQSPYRNVRNPVTTRLFLMLKTGVDKVLLTSAKPLSIKNNQKRLKVALYKGLKGLGL